MKTINLLAATRGGQALDERRVFRGSQTLLRGREQLALPQGFGMEPKSREDAGAEDAVVAGFHLLVLAARELTPDDGAGLQLHGEVFADARAAVKVELDTEVAREAGAAYFDDEFRSAGLVLAGHRGLATVLRSDAQEEVGLRGVFGSHHPGAVRATLTARGVAAKGEEPSVQVVVGGAVIRGYGRGHKNDSIDKFGLLEVGHRFPAAEEFRAVEAVAFMQGGRQCDGKTVHAGNSKFRLSRVLLGWLLFGGSLWAQGLYLDLSGDWRIGDDDRPEYARPDFDDRSWATQALPFADQYRWQRQYWIRRTVELPAASDRANLVLTLGTIQDVYEVYVNGRKIGASGRFDSFADAQVPRPRAFEVPALESGTLVIALRVRGVLFLHPDWRMPDAGPYLLSDRRSAPPEPGWRQVNERRLTLSPSLVFGSLFLAIGLLSFLGWRSDRVRVEYLWFSLVSFVRAGAAFYTFSFYDGHGVFTPAGVTWEYAIVHLDHPLFAEFVFAALGLQSWRLRTLVWLGWSVSALAVVLGADGPLLAIIGFPANFWVACMAIAVIIQDWWRRRGIRTSIEQHALRFTALLTALSFAQLWITAGYANWLWYRSPSRIVTRFELPFLAFGNYRFRLGDLFWLSISVVIVYLLFRRLAADRQDRQRLQGEMGAAQVAQQLLLGQQASVEASGFFIDPVYQPALEVGGDLYQIVERPDGRTLVLLGDVSGKGLKAAMMATLACGAIQHDDSESPAAVLGALNRTLSRRPSGGFITCCCLLLHPDGRVEIANAGHLSPYVNGREVEVEAGLPLGVVSDVTYRDHVIVLAPGEQLTLVSDGVVEAASATGELFGFDRTREISGKSASQIAEATEAWGQNDDITVVTVRRAG